MTILTHSRSTPKDVFIHLLATIMLYMSVYAVITLLFSCINVLLPDPLSFYYAGELNSIRLTTAMLIVAFPIYLFLAVFVHKMIKVEPGKSEIAARKWLTYFTVFLAAIMIIGDVITLLYNFLNGELSVRFFLKVLVVLVVACSVFGFYLWDIKSDGILKKQHARLVFFSASGAALCGIIIGFLVAGSPWYQRNVRFDEQRVNDLQMIQNEAVRHWTQKNVLPKTLENLVDSISGFRPPLDPKTNAPYEYIVTGKLAFTLCATFAAERGAKEGREFPMPTPVDPYQQNWNHDVGRTCFERTIDPELYRKTPDQPSF